MSTELVLQTKDLTDVGISSQLTSNDLLEVVAHDIFEKFMAEVNDCVKAERQLRERVYAVMQPEHDEMKTDLIKAKMIKASEEVNTGYSKINGDNWTSQVYALGLDIVEKDRGTQVKKDTCAIRFNYPVGSETKVKLKMTCNKESEDKGQKIKDIVCKISVCTNKEFEKTISISTERFKTLVAAIKEHNKRIEQVFELIPANGILSVERFTREARVKMNKKIISAQSPDFRKKISQLFNIKL